MGYRVLVTRVWSWEQVRFVSGGGEGGGGVAWIPH